MKELNLEDNYISTLPRDLSQIFENIENLNLNGNNFDEDEFGAIVGSLLTMPNLKSLFINLHEEEQVDLVMRSLEDLEFLNGLRVERDILEENEEGEEELSAMEGPDGEV